MIFISSSCIKKKNILDVLKVFKDNNINHVELSGGTENFPNQEKEIVNYIGQSDFEIRIHNYFPPPKKHFVINIASLNKEIYLKSIEQCLKAINLSKKFGSKKYSVHAGFLIDPKTRDLRDQQIKLYSQLFDEKSAILKMKEALTVLKAESGKDLDIYLENNVLNKKNFNRFGKNPFLLTDKNSYLKLKKFIDFNLLLDLAHLKVSCNTLGYDFYSEANFLYDQTDYLHLSGNDGIEDRNSTIISDNKLNKFLLTKNLKNKTITLEVYDNLHNIEKDYSFIKSLIK